MDAPSWISVGGGSSTIVAAPHKDMDEIIRKLRKTIDDAEKKGNQQDAELPYDVAEWTDRVLQAYVGQTKRNLNNDVTVTAAQHKDSRLLNLLENLEKDVRGRAYTVASSQDGNNNNTTVPAKHLDSSSMLARMDRLLQKQRDTQVMYEEECGRQLLHRLKALQHSVSTLSNTMVAEHKSVNGVETKWKTFIDNACALATPNKDEEETNHHHDLKHDLKAGGEEEAVGRRTIDDTALAAITGQMKDINEQLRDLKKERRELWTRQDQTTSALASRARVLERSMTELRKKQHGLSQLRQDQIDQTLNFSPFVEKPATVSPAALHFPSRVAEADIVRWRLEDALERSSEAARAQIRQLGSDSFDEISSDVSTQHREYLHRFGDRYTLLMQALKEDVDIVQADVPNKYAPSLAAQAQRWHTDLQRDIIQVRKNILKDAREVLGALRK